MDHETSAQLMPSDLGRRLRMRAGAEERLHRMPPAAVVELPEDDQARELMTFCSVEQNDQDAMLAARPDPTRDPDWWWLLRGAVAELRQRLDHTLPAGGFQPWPTVPRDAGPIGLFVYAWALLAVVPDVLALHRHRRIDEAVSRATLLDLGGVMNTHHQVTGDRGVGHFPLWGPPQSFSGINYTIGRHAFTRADLAVGGATVANTLMVHIPPCGPLVEAESRESIDRAIQFFADHFDDWPVAALVCTSWTLDPQLGQYLKPDANLLRFQRRFELLPYLPRDDDSDGDREMMRHGLDMEPPFDGPLTEADLAQVPQRTTLQRGFVDHIRSGRHWHNRTGIIWLPQHTESVVKP